MLTPMTQRLTVSWDRSITYFEVRWKILRLLEEHGLLYQFRVDRGIVFTRLGDANHLLSVSPDGLVLNVLQADSDLERVMTAARLVWDEISPSLTLDGGCAFQWLEEIDADYDSAKATMTAAVVASDLPGVVTADPAFLLVGEVDEPPLSFALECGIVEPPEIPSRLAREVGQLQHLARDEAPSTLWSTDRFPPVSYFCDSDWTIHVIEGKDGLTFADIEKAWAAAREAAERVVSSMMNRATGGENA